MSLSIAQCTALSIIERKANIEFDLLTITTQIQTLTNLAAEEATKLASYYTSTGVKSAVYMNDNSDEASDAIEGFNEDQYYAEYQRAMAEINAAEKILEVRQKNLETELQALNTREESNDKLLDSTIKEGFKYFQ